MVAPTQRHDAIGNKPNQIPTDRHQPPATLRPNRRLPVRDQPFSGDSMPTPVSPDALRDVLVGYNHNIVAYLLNGFQLQHCRQIPCSNGQLDSEGADARQFDLMRHPPQ